MPRTVKQLVPELDDARHAALTRDPDDSLNSPNMRKPLSGSLTMFIHQVKDVPHASANRFSRGPETFVIVKVEDTVKGRTKPTRNDKWTEELPVLDIEKANEIELTVYDKSGPYPTPIGMLWIRISDIAEEMRRKKLESELNNSQWVTADKMDNGSLHSRQDSAYSSTHTAQDRNSRGSSTRESQSHLANQDSSSKAAAKATAIDAWFALEPVGSIHLTMSFSRCFFSCITAWDVKFWQQNITKTRGHSILGLIAKALSVSGKKKSMNFMATNLCFSSFTISCAALSAAIS